MKELHLNKLFGIFTLCVFSLSCSNPSQIEATYESKIIDESLVEIDLLSQGQYTVLSEKYALAPTTDNIVLETPSRVRQYKIEIAGKVYMPEKNGSIPFIIFLHGNHATCGIEVGINQPRLDFALDYTTTGRCANGFVPVPSYLGYEYTAKHLASHGYGVISINANRGITGMNTSRWGESYFDHGLIAARGRLVLRTLEKFHRWNTGETSPFQNLDIFNKINFQHIGLVGHSRGGEGVRAAYQTFQTQNPNDYWKTRIPNLKFKGIFEIAPVDFGINVSGSQRTYEANGVPWNLLLAGCDKDVINFQGTQAYRRMLDFADGHNKSIYTVWGANHNFFNTEWQVSDADECIGEQEALWDINGESIAERFPEISRPIADYLRRSRSSSASFLLNTIGQGNAKVNITGSEQQRNIAKATILAFFKTNLGNNTNTSLLGIFDPQFRLPEQLSSQSLVSREFIQDDQIENVLTKAIPEVISFENLEVDTISEWSLQALNRLYRRLGTNSNQVNLSIPTMRQGLSLRWPDRLRKSISIRLKKFSKEDYWTIDFVMGSRIPCELESCNNPNTAVDARIILIDENGLESRPLQLTNYAQIRPLHDKLFLHSPAFERDLDYRITYIPLIMQTVRIELKDFKWSQNPSNINQVKLIIPGGSKGQLSIDDIHVVKP